MLKTKNPSKTVQLQTKILLAKAIIKNWDKLAKKEKKEIEQWWKETHGEFKE